MIVHLPLMIQDPLTARLIGIPAFGGIDVEAADDFRDFLDGPVTPRVAVIDFDPGTGGLVPGAEFVAALQHGKAGYRTTDDIYTPAFIQASVLGAVLKTMRLFERPEVLGRKIGWAFDGPQLFVVPRAGEWANAFYERDSRSLQFFSFKHPSDSATIVHTSLSRDIVAHETGHALIDGIAPALYDAVTPQSLAIHEALADLTALVTALDSPKLRERVLDGTGGHIRDSEMFSSLAPEFGAALDDSGGNHPLRNLHNDDELNPGMSEPHALSTVLSGALYAVLMTIYDRVWGQSEMDFSKSGYALAVARIIFERLFLRAIDFLPPGEVSFADYGRALVAAEHSATGTLGPEIASLQAEFLRRKIVADEAELRPQSIDRGVLSGVDVQLLLESDSDAYEFVNAHRALLRVPPGVPFRVSPRQHTHKNSKPDKGTDLFKDELILKVAWDVVEQHRFDSQLPQTRKVQCGTTLVLDWPTGAVEACLSADLPSQKSSRDQFIESLFVRGALGYPGEQRVDERSRTAVGVDVRSGSLSISGAARLLHVTGTGR